MRYLLAFLFGLGILINTNIANAYNCTTTNNFTFTARTINVSKGLNVGDKIGSSISSNIAIAYTCSDTTSMNMRLGFRSLGEYAMSAADGTRIYKTNIAGIGYALGGYISVCGTRTWITDGGGKLLNDVNTSLICIITSMANGNTAAYADIQLYKIAENTGSGTLGGQILGNVAMVADNTAYYPANQSIITMGNFQIISPGCTVTTPNISVVMGDIVKNKFNGIGTFIDNKTVNFNIELNCPANTSVLMRIDGNILDASKGLLNIAGGDTSAKGVAIQMLYNGLPLSLASPVSVGTSSTQGSFTIPLQARYYQSGTTVTPGAANGTATFTMTYQ